VELQSCASISSRWRRMVLGARPPRGTVAEAESVKRAESQRIDRLIGGTLIALNRKGFSLPLPLQRKPLQQIIQLQLRRLPPVEDRLDDIRVEQR